MFTKLVLPTLGGSPAVWSIAMVFFQSALLIGYAYAHLLVNRLTPRRAALVHLAMMGAVLLLALPIRLATGFGRPPSDGQAQVGTFRRDCKLPEEADPSLDEALAGARCGKPGLRDRCESHWV